MLLYNFIAGKYMKVLSEWKQVENRKSVLDGGKKKTAYVYAMAWPLVPHSYPE